MMMPIRLRKWVQSLPFQRFDHVVVLIWIGGMATSVFGYLIAFLSGDLHLVDAVFWSVLCFMGGSIATFGHIAISYYGGQLTKTIKQRYNHYFDVLYEQDVRRMATFIEIISDADIPQMFRLFHLYRYLGMISVGLFGFNVVIGRFVLPKILR